MSLRSLLFVFGGAAALIVAGAGSAFAQDEPQCPPGVQCPPGMEPYVPPVPPPTARAAPPQQPQAAFSPYMSAMSAGGGVTDFRAGSLRGNSSVGGTWNVRLTVGTRTIAAFEAEYLGSAQKQNDPTAPTLEPSMTTTNVTGSARLNLTKMRIQPFLVAGVGWINFHSFGRNDAPVAAVEWGHNDNGLVIPMGGGLTGYVGKHAMLDARFTYRLVSGSKDYSNTGARPDMWNASFNAGYAF